VGLAVRLMKLNGGMVRVIGVVEHESLECWVKEGPRERAKGNGLVELG
jgi:hypothetical protein